MTNVTTPVFVCRTSSATAYPVNVLVTLAAVLGEVYTGTEHTAYVCVSLVETLLYYSVYEGTAVEKHSLVRLGRCRTRIGSGNTVRRGRSSGADFFGNFLTSVSVTFPQFPILYLLYLRDLSSRNRKK